MKQKIELYDRFDGAIYGLAVGDAFGYPAELMSYEEMCQRFEKKGMLDLCICKKTGSALFTDDTQLALFTIEGLLWADTLGAKDGRVSYTEYIFYAYQEWLFTQTKTVASAKYSWIFDTSKNRFESRLLKSKGLYKKRSISTNNVDALLAAKNLDFGKIDAPQNSNQDNSALARVMPIGLYFSENTEKAFQMGAEAAAITHSRPSAYLSAGAFAALISELMKETELFEAVKIVMNILKGYSGFEKCYALMDRALELYDDENHDPIDAIAELGKGDTGEEAFAIALYSALVHDDRYEFAVTLAANHDGPSDTCAAVCGAILGVYRGVRTIPNKWRNEIQYKNLISDMSEYLYNETFEVEKD